MNAGCLAKTVRAALAVLFVSLLISADCGAQAWWFGKNKVQYKDFTWRVLTTPHFDLHFNGENDDLAARTAVILEYGYRKLSVDFNHSVKWRIPVILYATHSDFQQTNTTWQLLPEGVQAFAEPSRRRMVLHFSGSNVDFSHTAIHELVHIFQFDIIYGNLLRSVFSRNLLFNIPLWFAEGIAEYFSIGGMDDESEMFMRDATVFDYLPYDLNYAGGYMNYKAGQSAVDFLVTNYGKDKLIEVMDQLRFQRSLESALHGCAGLSTEDLTKEWKKSLRKKYWPVYAEKREPEYYARRLTDHVRKHHYMNSKPVFSPDGERLVYYSDRGGLEGIYLMNALTGEIEKELLVGSTSGEFEYIRTMKSSLTWSPEGDRIAFVAKSDGYDRLFVMSIPGGEITEKINLQLDFFFNPAWSPQGDRIALVGTIRGRTDIYVYEMNRRTLSRVTDDIDDEKYPSWFPDGGRIVYTRYPQNALQPTFVAAGEGESRMENIDFGEAGNLLEVRGDIWSIDLDSGEKKLLISTTGDDESGMVLAGGDEILFTSDETGIRNLYRGSLAVGSYYRFTDILGGIFNPSFSEERDRLVFSAFNAAGYDLFIMDNFLEKSRTSYSTGSPMLSGGADGEWPSFGLIPEEKPVKDMPSGKDDAACSMNRETSGGESGEQGTVDASGSVGVERSGGMPSEGPIPDSRWKLPAETPDVVVDEDAREKVHPDSLEIIRDRFREKIGTISPYKLRFSPDYVGNGMGLFFSTGFGFGLANQIAFSDLLGDHRLFFAFSLYGSLEDSDLMLSYYYVRKRIDYSAGVFQFKNYMNSRFSSIGETFTDYRYFSERNYGLYGNASYPFSTFTRAEMEVQAYMSEREFLVWEESDPYSGYFTTEGEVSTRRLLQPTFSLVHDSAYYGNFGPVIGSRWMLSFSKALSIGGDDVSRTTSFVDYRKYLPLFYRNYLAFRGVASSSEGPDRRYFFLGGPLTMRGYEYLQFQGSRMMLFNLEYRYPLVDAIIFGWPGRWGITNIGGTLFLDSGSVWGEGMHIEPLPNGVEPVEINEMEYYNDFGVGFYMRLGFLIMNFQLAWPTDFQYTGEPVFHFYLGPQF